MPKQTPAKPASSAPSTQIANTDRVFIFDTTLRDGEQCPGATMTFEEKLEVADFLEAMGVDIIEAGFPIASEGDFQAVSEIAKRIKKSVVCGLSRAGELDIDRAGEAVKNAARPRIHVFVNASDVQLAQQLRKGRDEVLSMAGYAVRRARQSTDDVEFSPMDATRADPKFVAEIVRVALEAGARTINLPDTVGYARPDQVAELFRRLMYPELKGREGRAAKADIAEEPVNVPLRVNAKYPSTSALPTVPANLLANLPQLPEDVEYRIVDKHLILRDVDANIILGAGDPEILQVGQRMDGLATRFCGHAHATLFLRFIAAISSALGDWPSCGWAVPA